MLLGKGWKPTTNTEGRIEYMSGLENWLLYSILE